MRLVGYVRVSTDDQAAEGVSLDAQRRTIETFARAGGHELAGTVQDGGVSAADLMRPGIGRVLAMLDAGKADGLIVTKLDRLTRNCFDLEELLHDHFGADAPHRLVLVEAQHDAKTPAGRLMLRILCALAEHELDQVAARTRAAVEHKRANGEAVGPTPFGYDRAGERLVANVEEQATLARARALRAEHLGLRAIARALNDEGRPAKRGGRWDASTVKRLLERASDT